jgi:hypothetical protein
LDSIVDTFTIEHVSAVDTLIQSFIEKGSDRATDILLSGQFNAFFSLTSDEVSYAGALQSATRAVAMNDLPVSKYNRASNTTSPLTGQAQSPDYEFTGSDLNENLGGAQVDPPQDAGQPSTYGLTTGSQGAGT